MRIWLLWLALAAAVALCGCYGADSCAKACAEHGGRLSHVGLMTCSCSGGCVEARP